MLRVEALPGGMALGSVAEQRDPYGVTEPRVRHAVGISEARRAERPFQGDRVYVPP